MRNEFSRSILLKQGLFFTAKVLSLLLLTIFTHTQVAHCQSPNSDTLIHSQETNPIDHIFIPTICAGDDIHCTIGFHSGANILLHSNVSSLIVDDTIFLPDGVHCDPYGCSYRSPVTFSDFSPHAVIRDVNDIQYVRLNLEHSFCGDLYINITCPNGQKADIMKFKEGYSPCSSNISNTSRGWAIGNNASTSNFGLASNVSHGIGDKCLSENYPAGIGWNYCWSNNTSPDFTYAPGTGSLVYRSVHAHHGVIDSSDVANKSNFYHPDESFSNLIGCPMNGTWYIEVMDGYSLDNGYIFEWELSLTPELTPYHQFALDTFTIEGPWASLLDSATFTIKPPHDLPNDTLVHYHITLYDNEGHHFDSTFTTTIKAAVDTLLFAELCAGNELSIPNFHFIAPQTNHPFDTILATTIERVEGCDSTIFLHISIFPTYETNDTLNLFHNQLPYTLYGETITTSSPLQSTRPINLTTIKGCDSLVNLVVIIHPNDTTLVDTILCANQIPYLWNGIAITSDTSLSVTLQNSLGGDSLVYINVHLTPNPIKSVQPISTICAGETYPLLIGYNNNATVVLEKPTASHYDSQKIFLPDGISCQPYGTYYRSYAHFDHFVPNTVVTSVNDIRYLRLKMEHSAIEDLRIQLVCPNNQSCTIVPDEYYDGWGVVPHTYFRINLGLANRLTDHLSCDSTLNPIGTPWNYIWSNNTNQGYQYAHTTFGYCYELNNIHLQNNPFWDNTNNLGMVSYVIDSSNLAQMTKIYHPLESFSNMIGCPLNGEWYIQIQDLQEQDNGYLVEWELALDPSFLRIAPPAIIERTIEGPWLTRTSDSTFLVAPPSQLANDTTIAYTVLIEDSLGCLYDTSFTLQFHAIQHTSIFDTIVQNMLPYQYNRQNFTSFTPQDQHQTFHRTCVHGCDSIINYHLHIIPNDTIHIYDTLCSQDLPYTWNGMLFSQAGTQMRTYQAHTGADSVVIMTLHTHDSNLTMLYDTICQGMPYLRYGFNLPADSTQYSTIFTQTLTNTNDCDSIVQLSLTILPNTTQHVNREIVENALPYSFLDQTFYHDTANVVFHIPNSAGCDSTILFSLLVHHNTHTILDSTVCDYELPIKWNGRNISAPSTTITLHNIFGADSVVTLNLNIISTNIEITSLTENFCDNMQAVLEVHTTLTNYIWNNGFTHSPITVYSPGTYSVTGSQDNCHAQTNFTILSCELNLYLPNTITPGIQDGLNDYFYIPEAYLSQIESSSFYLAIYNRFGEIVFISTDKHFRWDGTIKNRQPLNETYHYVMRFQNEFGKSTLLKGSILVL